MWIVELALRRPLSVAVMALLMLVLARSPSLLAVPPLAANMDGVIMSGGKMMRMQMGKAMGPMDHEMTMANGTTVAPNGTLRMKDGTVIHLKNGQMVMMDGHIMTGGKATAMHR